MGLRSTNHSFTQSCGKHWNWTSHKVCTGCQPNECEIGNVFSKLWSCVGMLLKILLSCSLFLTLSTIQS